MEFVERSGTGTPLRADRLDGGVGRGRGARALSDPATVAARALAERARLYRPADILNQTLMKWFAGVCPFGGVADAAGAARGRGLPQRPTWSRLAAAPRSWLPVGELPAVAIFLGRRRFGNLHPIRCGRTLFDFH